MAVKIVSIIVFQKERDSIDYKKLLTNDIYFSDIVYKAEKLIVNIKVALKCFNLLNNFNVTHGDSNNTPKPFIL